MNHVIAFTVGDVLRLVFATLPAAIFWIVVLWAIARYAMERWRQHNEDEST